MVPCVIVIMGVSGSGKTTIGTLLAKKLGFVFLDADDFHPGENVAKMQSGEPLSDADRKGWLLALRVRIDEACARGECIVLACSALRAEYRLQLGLDRPGCVLVYLRATLELVRERMARRKEHFMPTSLAKSQFATLEEPSDALVVDAAHEPDAIVQEITARLALVGS